MAIIVLGVLAGSLLFLIGIISRKRKLTLLGTPAALLLIAWVIMANVPPDPEKEFVLRFGSSGKAKASNIQTSKPMFMDGYFISFHMSAADFDAEVRPLFSERKLNDSFLWGQSLPKSWPVAASIATHALHREVKHDDVFLLYFTETETAYAAVRYGGW